MTRVLGRVQRALEGLYRVEARADVRDFVISEEQRQALGVERRPDEQLLLRDEPGGLAVGLFVNQASLRRLEDLSGGPPPDEHLEDFLLAVEGVSHFVYVTVRAQAERPFSALELELQAEVDKYLLVLLSRWREGSAPPAGIRRRLFGAVSYHDDLSHEELRRYRTANDAADEYVASLEHRFVRHRAVGAMLDEMRRFWRLDCAGKLEHIGRKAA